MLNSMNARYAQYADEELLAILDRWQQSLAVAQRSKDAYAGAMLAYLKYLDSIPVRFCDATKGNIEAFRAWLKKKKYRSSTISLYMAGIRSFYRYYGEQDPSLNLAKDIKGAKPSHSFKREALTREQALELLASIMGKKDPSLIELRDFALINLMIRTGLRDIEVARARCGDIGFDKDANIPTLDVQGKGKNEKDDFVVLEDEAHSPILIYKKERARFENVKELDDDAPLFASLAHNSVGAPLTTRSISRIVKNRLCAIGLSGSQYTAHSLRHTAITFSLLGGATVQQAQAMARHADINTTLIYSHNLNRVKDAAENHVASYLKDE